jgi:hypothetical protein
MANKFWGGGGDPNPHWPRDYVFPRTGKDMYGKDKRVSPVEFSRELATWNEHVTAAGGIPMGIAGGTEAMGRNKLQPVLSSILELHDNKNFYGMQIRDPNDLPLKQLGDVAKFALTNILPIPFQGLAQPTGQPYSWVDATYAFLGFPKAAAWTGRSETENRIVDTVHRLNPRVKTQENMDRAAQYEKLREAVIAKNDKERDVTRAELQKLKVPLATITRIEHHPNESYVHQMWKSLPIEEQKKILAAMSPEERKEYLPIANKTLRGATP